MVQVVEHSPSKHKTLSSKPEYHKKKRKKRLESVIQAGLILMILLLHPLSLMD
jgi:hypothetical protein